MGCERNHSDQRQKTLSSIKPITAVSLFAITLLSTFALWSFVLPQRQVVHAASTLQVGAEVSGGDSDRAFPFVDAQKWARGFTQISDTSKNTPLDAHGWPQSDFAEVIFDYRPFPAWAPPVEDPENFQPDVSGTYHVSFTGQATIAPFAGDSGATGAFTIANQSYNSATNTTTADLNMAAGKGLLYVQFTNTKRNPGDSAGTGITNLKIIRPGYAANTTQTFTDVFLNSIAPFSYIRVMDWLSINNNNPYFGDAKNTLDWADRTPPNYATQADYNGHHGLSWEYIIQAANTSNKDLWINIPTAATNDYITQLATLLKNNLHAGLHVYVEYSNEVWNFGFLQYTYNKMAAQAEVNAGGSNLNNDGNSDPEVWARRRYIKQTINISNIFKSVYGAAAINTTIRPVNAWWEIQPGQFQEQLAWAQANYGNPNQYIWGIASGDYASTTYPTNVDTSNNDSIINGLNASSDAQRTDTQQLRSTANTYGLHLAHYEIGLDFSQDTNNLPVKFNVNRHDARIKDVVTHHLTNSQNDGVDVGTWFALATGYSHYGFWGLTEDAHNLNTYKFQGIYAFQGSTPPNPTPTATSTPTSTSTPTPGNWTKCADEGATCTFTGTQQVRYGANGTYNYQTATNSIACTNAVFGDPTPGVFKHCDVASGTSSTPTPTPTSTPTPTPGPGQTVANASFETPNVGTGGYSAFQYNPSGATWSFSAQNGADGAGIAGNGSGFTSSNPNAPDGTQVAFIQSHGTISQTVNFTAGSYKVNFKAAQRANVNSSSEDFQILIDNNVVGTFTPSGSSYSSYSSNSFTVTAGNHTVQFKGLDTAGGDNTTFIDSVSIA